MTDHDFIMWFQGYFDALGDEPPTHKDWRIITGKLGMVRTAPAQTATLNYPPMARGTP